MYAFFADVDVIGILTIQGTMAESIRRSMPDERRIRARHGQTVAEGIGRSSFERIA